MTDAEIDAAAASDPDAQPTDEAFWKDARGRDAANANASMEHGVEGVCGGAALRKKFSCPDVRNH